MGDHVAIDQRIYRGKIDRPKTTRSKRLTALSPDTLAAVELWRAKTFHDDPKAWGFPSEKLTTPMGRDNLWRRDIEPRLKAINLDWVNFQVMRRTHASLSRKAGIDPKLVVNPNLLLRRFDNLERRMSLYQPFELEPGGFKERSVFS